MKVVYLLIRWWLQSSSSKESLDKRSSILAKLLQFKYEPLEKLAQEGIIDVTERLDFLLQESSGKVLDIGCYDGFFSIELRKNGCRVTGLDMLQIAVDHANKSVNGKNMDVKFIKGYSEDLPFPNKEFDTTIVSHTLEHVFDHHLSLAEAARVTKTGGKLIAIIPNGIGNSPAHLRHISSSGLHSMMLEYCTLGKELTIGKGIGYIGIVK